MVTVIRSQLWSCNGGYLRINQKSFSQEVVMSDASSTQINEARLTDFREWPHLQFISVFLPWTFFGTSSVASSTSPLISEPLETQSSIYSVFPLLWHHEQVNHIGISQGLPKSKTWGRSWRQGRVAERPHIPESCWAAPRGPRNKPQGTGPSPQLVLWPHKRWKLAQKPHKERLLWDDVTVHSC